MRANYSGCASVWNQSELAELVSARDFIRWGASRMLAADVAFGHGTDNAVDEAAYLVAHALHFAPLLPEGFLDARLTAAEKEAVATLVEQRVTLRVPAAYLTGEAWFAGLRFAVDERVLVPRSPIAELIETRFEPWVDAPPKRILDLCTGSGCIGIACAVHLDAEVVATDISVDALAVARENVTAHGVDHQVSCVQSDVYAALDAEEFDLIVSNPPYVSAAECAGLPAEYRAEPELGLRSGEDGLDVPLRILAGAPRHLRPGGTLVLEVGATGAALDAALPEGCAHWIAFERGGDGVCQLEGAGLAAASEAAAAALATRRLDGR